MSAPAPSVDDLLDRERRALDRRIRELAAREPGGTAPRLQEAIRYACEGGGKRLRGGLCLLAHRALAGPGGEGGYDVAAAVELVHTYSLVHDDLPCMDNDDLRRGRPTLHRVFGSRVAALAGLALIPLAFQVLLRGARTLGLAEGATRELALALARGIGAGGMVGGQWLDLAAEGRAISPAELARIHAAKTGALFRSAVAMGGISAGGTADQVRALGEYGAALGLAFQVVDDLLDELGDSSALGKTAGKDRRQGKATYPGLLGRDASAARARAAVAEGVAQLRRAGIASAELEAAGDWVLARDH